MASGIVYLYNHSRESHGSPRYANMIRKEQGTFARLVLRSTTGKLLDTAILLRPHVRHCVSPGCRLFRICRSRLRDRLSNFRICRFRSGRRITFTDPTIELHHWMWIFRFFSSINIFIECIRKRLANYEYCLWRRSIGSLMRQSCDKNGRRVINDI